ncbi:MAG: acetate kinase, partial [Phycisphaerae bacterium]|nr:acetate kinase [Phycisphaerae bacterium]
MKVFVVNCGSSSIKYQLFEMTDESVLAKGFLERIGTSEAVLHHIAGGQRNDSPVEAPDHSAGLMLILKALTDPGIGVLANLDEIACAGHRVVHGGEQMHQSALIDETIIALVRENA